MVMMPGLGMCEPRRTNGLEETRVDLVEAEVGRQRVLREYLEEVVEQRLGGAKLLNSGEGHQPVQLHHLRQTDCLHRRLHSQSAIVSSLRRRTTASSQIPHQMAVSLRPAHPQTIINLPTAATPDRVGRTG